MAKNMDQMDKAEAENELRFLLNEWKAYATTREYKDRISIERRTASLFDYFFCGGQPLDVKKIFTEAAKLPIQE